MLPVSPQQVWDGCPFGIAIYVPEFDNDGVFCDLTLLWSNERMTELVGFDLGTVVGKHLSEVSESGWRDVRDRYALMIESGKGFSYARQYDNNTHTKGFDYMATVWWAPPYATVLVTQESLRSLDETITDPSDIATAMRLIESRAQKTLQLAASLRDVDPAGLEPATSGISSRRSSI